MTWSRTWPRPPAENHVRTDAKLAEPGSCLENRASFAISLARCEAETAAMPSPWASSRRSSPPSALPRPSHGVCLRRHHPRSSDVGATTSDDVGRAWHVALVVPAPWGQRRRATRWQGLATATRWQSLETRASQNVQHCSTLTHNDIGRARWQSQAHRQPAARLRQLRCRPPQALPGRSAPPSALHRPSHGACLRRHHPRPPGWLVVLVVPAPRGQRR